ncbi:hypothetical protein HDV06_001489 [Boothiomyces sp. JEL0866]|nr:hypothetical protein HDV06_001489 [Boothiomyces sp. JEL0866]
MSTDESFKDEQAGDRNEIWKNTSTWRPIQLEILKVNFIDSDYIDLFKDKILLKDIDLDNELDVILLPNINMRNPPDRRNIPKKQLIFFNKLLQIKKFNDEPPVNSVSYELLRNIGFEDVYLHFREEPKLKLDWRDVEITSKADFGVYKGEDIEDFCEYLLVVEDKKINKNLYLNGECQLFGEMLLAASNNFKETKNEQKIFGLIIRGFNVKFYTCFFDKDYLNIIEFNKKQTKKINVIRYPPNNVKGLSLYDYEERKNIIKILQLMKKELDN